MSRGGRHTTHWFIIYLVHILRISWITITVTSMEGTNQTVFNVSQVASVKLLKRWGPWGLKKKLPALIGVFIYRHVLFNL